MNWWYLGAFFRNSPFENKWPTHLLSWAPFCLKGMELWMNSTYSKTKPRKSHARKRKAESGEFISITLRQIWLQLWSYQNSCCWSSMRHQVILCLMLLCEQNIVFECQLSPVVITHRSHTKMFSFKIKGQKVGEEDYNKSGVGKTFSFILSTYS